MIRLIFYILLFYLGYRLIKSWTSSQLHSKERGEFFERSRDMREAELVRDPHCGVFFMKGQGVSASIDGQTLHFCSQACRAAYLRKKE